MGVYIEGGGRVWCWIGAQKSEEREGLNSEWWYMELDAERLEY